MPKTKLNGWEIYYEDSGGNGLPVFLVHGLLMDRTMFAPQVEALNEKFRLITPDCRGHGESEKKHEDFTQWDMAEDWIALADQLGIEKAVFGGVSQGGFQSLRLALKNPERVLGLILIETQAGTEDENKAPMYEASAEVVAADGYKDEILEVATISMFGSSASDELKQHWIERWKKTPADAGTFAMRAVTRRDDITDRLSEIKAPAIVIHGEEDVAIEMERAEILAKGLPNLTEFVKIPGAGHSSTVEQPKLVTEAIEGFLEGL